MKLRMLLGIAALTLAACLAALPGCYTVLKHPAQVSMTDDHGGRRSCADCHDQSHYYHDPYMYRYYDRYSYADRWYGYYYDPWWYDEPERATPPARGATTAVGNTGSPAPATQPKASDSGSSSSSSGSVDKDKRTRWGGEPARATPPKKSSEPEKSGNAKEPKKKTDDPKK